MHSTMSTIMLAFSALAVSTAARSVKPDFCGSVDCPPYTVVKYEPGYELRKYEKATWATAPSSGSSYSDALGVSFDKLFAYIEGANVEGKKIPMTAPVLGKAMTDESFEFTGEYEFSFYVPNAAIAPADSGVSITETPEDFEVYVASFGGYASAADWEDAAKGLKVRLDAAGFSYDDSHFFTAGYDSPFHFINRHNEVWIAKKESSV